MAYPHLFQPLDLGVEYRKIDHAGVHIAGDGKEIVVAADTVIACAGQDPERAAQL